MGRPLGVRHPARSPRARLLHPPARPCAGASAAAARGWSDAAAAALLVASAEELVLRASIMAGGGPRAAAGGDSRRARAHAFRRGLDRPRGGAEPHPRHPPPAHDRRGAASRPGGSRHHRARRSRGRLGRSRADGVRRLDPRHRRRRVDGRPSGARPAPLRRGPPVAPRDPSRRLSPILPASPPGVSPPWSRRAPRMPGSSFRTSRRCGSADTGARSSRSWSSWRPSSHTGRSIAFWCYPRLDSSEEPSLVARMRRYVTREAVLALGVFAVTAVLTESTPPRHVGHTEHVQENDADPDARVRTITIEALHASGGVPHRLALRAPASAAARGREVFARLQCYACRRDGESTTPGPPAPVPSSPAWATITRPGTSSNPCSTRTRWSSKVAATRTRAAAPSCPSSREA